MLRGEETGFAERTQLQKVLASPPRRRDTKGER